MRLDRRFFVVLSASLLWATLVSAVFYRMASGSGGHTVERRRAMVIATRALPMGATVDRASVELREVPDGFFPTGGFSQPEEVWDRPVISPIQPGEPVVEARLAAKGSGMGLAPLIPNGMRALSVRVNDVVGVAGFILPGMRVDVLVTGRPSGQAETVTRTVLQNIAVLSAGQTIQTDGKSQSIQVPVVTLLVNPQEAEALTLANNEGKVQLVLRNSSDDKTAATAGRRLNDLYGGGIPAALVVAAPVPRPTAPMRPVEVRAPKPAAPEAPAVNSAPIMAMKLPQDEIEVIHGKTKTLEVFAKGRDHK